MKVYIRSRRGGFCRDGHPALSCQPDGSLQANRFGNGQWWEEWELEHRAGGKIALRSHHNQKYLSAKACGDVRADRDHIETSEEWIVENVPDGCIALKSCFGSYLVCDDFHACGRIVRADHWQAEEWEHWAIVDTADALTNPGYTAQQAVNGSLVAVGSLISAGALAIPLLGFGVGGVAAGSAAATIQSALYGGATTGVFSMLQSAGATLAWVPIASCGATVAALGRNNGVY